jgi:hypothetical protein
LEQKSRNACFCNTKSAEDFLKVCVKFPGWGQLLIQKREDAPVLGSLSQKLEPEYKESEWRFFLGTCRNALFEAAKVQTLKNKHAPSVDVRVAEHAPHVLTWSEIDVDPALTLVSAGRFEELGSRNNNLANIRT